MFNSIKRRIYNNSDFILLIIFLIVLGLIAYELGVFEFFDWGRVTEAVGPESTTYLELMNVRAYFSLTYVLMSRGSITGSIELGHVFTRMQQGNPNIEPHHIAAFFNEIKSHSPDATLTSELISVNSDGTQVATQLASNIVNWLATTV